MKQQYGCKSCGRPVAHYKKSRKLYFSHRKRLRLELDAHMLTCSKGKAVAAIGLASNVPNDEHTLPKHGINFSWVCS